MTPEILREHAAGHTPNAARRRRMYARAYAYTALAAAEQLLSQQRGQRLGGLMSVLKTHA